jgi:hypothetical protein
MAIYSDPLSSDIFEARIETDDYSARLGTMFGHGTKKTC